MRRIATGKTFRQHWEKMDDEQRHAYLKSVGVHALVVRKEDFTVSMVTEQGTQAADDLDHWSGIAGWSGVVAGDQGRLTGALAGQLCQVQALRARSGLMTGQAAGRDTAFSRTGPGRGAAGHPRQRRAPPPAAGAGQRRVPGSGLVQEGGPRAPARRPPSLRARQALRDSRASPWPARRGPTGKHRLTGKFHLPGTCGISP